MQVLSLWPSRSVGAGMASAKIHPCATDLISHDAVVGTDCDMSPSIPRSSGGGSISRERKPGYSGRSSGRRETSIRCPVLYQ